jgi:hypothetical protein
MYESCLCNEYIKGLDAFIDFAEKDMLDNIKGNLCCSCKHYKTEKKYCANDVLMSHLIKCGVCLVSLFGGVSATKRKKSEKAHQTVCFFSAAMKRGFVGPLPFQLKCENRKSQGESGFYAPSLG